jgi:hypothetical protein
MVIEELILMVITVLLAIWSLASRNVSRGGKLFTSNNALFWGLAFGFGYAGSIAMLTSMSGSGNLAKTMAIGHIITAITILILHPFVLKKHLKNMGKDSEDEKITPTIEVTIPTDEESHTPIENSMENDDGDIDFDDLELDEVIEILD